MADEINYEEQYVKAEASKDRAVRQGAELFAWYTAQTHVAPNCKPIIVETEDKVIFGWVEQEEENEEKHTNVINKVKIFNGFVNSMALSYDMTRPQHKLFSEVCTEIEHLQNHVDACYAVMRIADSLL